MDSKRAMPNPRDHAHRRTLDCGHHLLSVMTSSAPPRDRGPAYCRECRATRTVVDRDVVNIVEYAHRTPLRAARRAGNVDAVITRRLLQDLACRQWAAASIASLAGGDIRATWVTSVRQGRTVSVAAWRADAVLRVWRELEGTTGPSAHAADKARLLGWVPGDAWRNILDPHEETPAVTAEVGA